MLRCPRLLLALASALTCVTFAGCDGRLQRLLLGGHPGDLAQARALYERAQHADQQAQLELQAHADSQHDVYAGFYAGLAMDPSIAGDNTDAPRAAKYYAMADPLPAAKHNLALLLLKGQLGSTAPNASPKATPLDQALKLLQDAAADGQVDSALLLGALYDQGWPGLQVDQKQARQWFHRAVETSNDPRAHYRLGMLLDRGKSGQAADAAAARQHLVAAAELGLVDAQVRLAHLETDPVRAAQWALVASASDARFKAAEHAALQRLSTADADLARRNAGLWLRAHPAPVNLRPFTQPLLVPQ